MPAGGCVSSLVMTCMNLEVPSNMYEWRGQLSTCFRIKLSMTVRVHQHMVSFGDELIY